MVEAIEDATPTPCSVNENRSEMPAQYHYWTQGHILSALIEVNILDDFSIRSCFVVVLLDNDDDVVDDLLLLFYIKLMINSM